MATLVMTDWEAKFRSFVESQIHSSDPAHDMAHFNRVVSTAKRLCELEGASFEVVVPSAWFHDLVNLPKNDPRRAEASRLSAEAALKFLGENGYPSEYFPKIKNAIEAHSFSAEIAPESIEAEIVQDADRLDGVGAIGIARCFSVGALLGKPLYEANDPRGETRPLDDKSFTLDHFYTKLFKTAETLRTRAGKQEGQKRAETMRKFLNEFFRELNGF